MKIAVLLFVVIGILISLATITLVIVDFVREGKKRNALVKQEKQSKERKDTQKLSK